MIQINNQNTNYPSDSHLKSNTRTDKMMGKKTLMAFGISLLLLISLSTVMASAFAAYQKPETSAGPGDLQRAQNQFEYRYQYECEDCSVNTYIDGDKIRLEVREQKRLFGLFDVETVSNYELNEEAEIVRARHNIWARLFQTKVEVN